MLQVSRPPSERQQDLRVEGDERAQPLPAGAPGCGQRDSPARVGSAEHGHQRLPRGVHRRQPPMHRHGVRTLRRSLQGAAQAPGSAQASPRGPHLVLLHPDCQGPPGAPLAEDPSPRREDGERAAHVRRGCQARGPRRREADEEQHDQHPDWHPSLHAPGGLEEQAVHLQLGRLGTRMRPVRDVHLHRALRGEEHGGAQVQGYEGKDPRAAPGVQRRHAEDGQVAHDPRALAATQHRRGSRPPQRSPPRAPRARARARRAPAHQRRRW